MAVDTWVAAFGGALGGSLVSAAVATLTVRAGWRREDQHRFTVQRRDAYVDFLDAHRARSIAVRRREVALNKFDDSASDVQLRADWLGKKQTADEALVTSRPVV